MSHNESIRSIFAAAVAEIPAHFREDDWFQCLNCSAHTQGYQVLLDTSGNRRCPDCCSIELVPSAEPEDPV